MMLGGLTASDKLEHQPAKLTKRFKSIFYLRILAFFLIETVFIALAAWCLAHPIELSIPHVGNQEVAHGFTVVSVLWQTLAVVAAEHIITDAFSREWAARHGRMSDRVSTITSGFLDRITHLITKSASKAFGVAFLASLLLLILTKLSPGTISAVTIPVNVPTQVQVGGLLSSFTEELFSKTYRVYKVVYLEQIEHSQFGWKLQPNWLVAYPVVDSTISDGPLEYDSDVVKFHHDCYWEAPQFLHDQGGRISVLIGGQTWETVLGPAKPGIPASSITHLSLTSSFLENTSTSAFLFIGGNDTFLNHHINPPVHFSINLGSLPTTVLPPSIGAVLAAGTYVGPLSSILVCDAQYQISGGRARLSPNGTLHIIRSGGQRIGNFPDTAANLIFSTALRQAVFQFEPLSNRDPINDVSSAMFMANSTIRYWGIVKNIPPADITTINKNMDMFLLSAAKVYIDGRNSPTFRGDPVPSNLETIPAAREELRLVLATSEALFITVTVVFAFTLLSLFAVCQSTFAGSGRPLFDIHGVLSILQTNGERLPIDSRNPESNRLLDE